MNFLRVLVHPPPRECRCVGGIYGKVNVLEANQYSVFAVPQNQASLTFCLVLPKDLTKEKTSQ